MGKHERSEIEQMERSVVQYLNKKKPTVSPGDKWYKHMEAFVHYIIERYPKIAEAYHVGNEYGTEVGDIKLLLEDRSTYYIELKSSETPFGRGTLANISQDSVTEYELLIPPKGTTILSWSEFRELHGLKTAIQAALNLNKIAPALRFEDKARFIRDKANAGDPQARKIVNIITNLANDDKKEYINYLKFFTPNEENIIKFVFCLLNGIHTMPEIKQFMNSVSSCHLQDRHEEQITLYANLQGGDVIVTERKSKIRAMLDDNDRFSILFPDEFAESNNNYIVCCDKATCTEKKLLSFVFHWKNVFQGIQTPCINVFLGSYFEE
jgi:hypothetical protein